VGNTAARGAHQIAHLLPELGVLVDNQGIIEFCIQPNGAGGQTGRAEQLDGDVTLPRAKRRTLLIRLDRHATGADVRPAQEFLVPLVIKIVRRHEGDAKARVSLSSESAQHHKGLDGFAEPDLIGQEEPTRRVRRHLTDIVDLMGIAERGHP
jgi:hypothetical protein